MNRSNEEFYISKPYELSDGAKITNIDWDADLPAKTWVKAQLRTAQTSEKLEDAEWQEVDDFKQEGLWAQYKLTLGATNCCRSPRIKKVTVNFIKNNGTFIKKKNKI